MANETNNNMINTVNELPPPFTTHSSRSIPLHLSGFLTGDTVQVQGDTGQLQFSLQFNFHKTPTHHDHHATHVHSSSFNLPDTNNVPDVDTSSSYLTPSNSTTHEIVHDHDHNADDHGNVMSEESWSRGEVVTRLRSGVLSPVKYYGTRSYGVLSVGYEKKRKKKTGEKVVRSGGENVFEKMLRRRSLPLRPCNSYAFFLMANWGSVVKCSSFVEKSKRLSKKWYKLPNDLKKEFEQMALKDNARYKRQCVLLRNDAEQEMTSGSSQAMSE